jgi:two-component system chemotaxis response regulator CheY
VFKRHLVDYLQKDPAEVSGILSFHDIDASGAGLMHIAQNRREAAREKARDGGTSPKQGTGEPEIPPELVKTLPQRRAARKALRVLIVEDDPFSRMLIGSALAQDCSLSYVETGENAVREYLDKAPDIVFMDVDLSDVSGYDVLIRIQGLDPGAFIVMLCGNGLREHVLRAIGSGAKGFVGKPFTREKLLHYIARCPKAQAEEVSGKSMEE